MNESKTSLVCLTFAVPPLPKRILNTDWFLIIISFSLASPCLERPFCTAFCYTAFKFILDIVDAVIYEINVHILIVQPVVSNLSTFVENRLFKKCYYRIIPVLLVATVLRRSATSIFSPYLSWAAFHNSRISHPRDSSALLPGMGDRTFFSICFRTIICRTNWKPCHICQSTSSLADDL